MATIGGIFLFRYLKNKEIPATQLLQPGALEGPSRPQQAEILSAQEIIKWTNFHREQNGLSPLEGNDKLTSAAQLKVDDMFKGQYFAHSSPSGADAGDLAEEVNYQYKTLGENLALGNFLDEKELVQAWLDSPGHRANILNRDFSQIGVATSSNLYQGRRVWLAVQEFGKPLPLCFKPSEELKRQIEENQTKTQPINTLANQITALYQEANQLISQGNDKIEQGNLIFAETGDQSQAQPYWDEGKALQEQGQAKINEAKQLEGELQTLQNLAQQTQTLIEEYNRAIENYNQCMAK
mgnify:CR=1 FL=1